MAASSAMVRDTDALSYTTDAGIKHKCVVFEIDAGSQMDIAGGFAYVGVSTGASSASNITSALLLIQPNYMGDNQPEYTT